MITVNEHVGVKISEYMLKLGINGVELSRALGITRTTLRSYRKGKMNIDVTKINKLCGIFNCGYTDLLPPIPIVKVTVVSVKSTKEFSFQDHD